MRKIMRSGLLLMALGSGIGYADSVNDSFFIEEIIVTNIANKLLLDSYILGDNVETFTNKATEMGYSQEQIDGIIATSDVSKLNDFNFDLFPKKVEADLGGNADENNQDLTRDEQMSKYLGHK